MADGFVIRLNRESTDRLLRKLERSLANETQLAGSQGIILRRTTRELKGEIQQKILTGDRGRWAKLTPLTRGRHGRTVPLQPLAGRVKSRFRGSKAEIYFDSPSPSWNLTMHHEGFGVSQTTANMRIPQLSGMPLFIRSRRAFRVPARPVWPSERHCVTVLNRNIRRFISHIEHGSSTTFGPAQ